MNKWFVEVIRDENGRFSANMMIDGRVVDGLLRDVDYYTLKKDILDKTGKEIFKRKDMLFGACGSKTYAYLDFTQERADCRVPVWEVVDKRHPWRPSFDGRAEFIGKQVVLGPHMWKAESFGDLYFEVGTVVGHKPTIYGELCAYAGSFSVRLSERFYVDKWFEKIKGTYEMSDNPDLLSSRARDLALRKVHDLREDVEIIMDFPRKSNPKFDGVAGPFYAYFAAMDFEAFSDSQLVLADKLAAKYLGAMSHARQDIHREMVERFEGRTTLEGRLEKAKQRLQGKQGVQGVQAPLDGRAVREVLEK